RKYDYRHSRTHLTKFSAPHADLHSFPTRRSSDLACRRSAPRLRRSPARDNRALRDAPSGEMFHLARRRRCHPRAPPRASTPAQVDRKSTRLNSSHLVISYAVFCLKKKKIDRKSQK